MFVVYTWSTFPAITVPRTSCHWKLPVFVIPETSTHDTRMLFGCVEYHKVGEVSTLLVPMMFRQIKPMLLVIAVFPLITCSCVVGAWNAAERPPSIEIHSGEV